MVADHRPRLFPGNVVQPLATGPLPPVHPPNSTPHVLGTPSIVQLVPSRNSYPERFKEGEPCVTAANATANAVVASAEYTERFSAFMIPLLCRPHGARQTSDGGSRPADSTERGVSGTQRGRTGVGLGSDRGRTVGLGSDRGR